MLSKKCFLVGILTLLNVSLAIAAPPAVHPVTGEPLVIDCLRGTPDAIDGDLSDWNLEAMTPAVLDVAEQLFSGQDSWAGPEDCSGEFYLLWDDENIYMAVVVKDEKLSMNKSGGDIWNADAIEVFFSTTNAVAGHAEHYQYGFNANNQRWNWCNMDGAGSIEPDYLQVASSVTADGYICEASIPYGQMPSLDFSAGNTIGFHPVFDDTDNGDRELQMTWTGREAHDQSLGFGHIVLSAEPPAAPALPDGWQSQDIGTTGGSAAESDGTWVISADGADVWGSADEFHYAYMPLSGDGTIIAQVISNGEGSNGWAKGGVMIRETLDADSKHAIMALTGGEGGGMAFQNRQETGGSSFSSHGDPAAAPPYWVKLKRAGNTITGYSSADGVEWVQQPDGTGGDMTTNPVEIEMAADVYIGLFVTSHASGEIRTYTFDNVSVVPPAGNIIWVSYHGADDEPHADAAAVGFTQAPDIGYTDLLKANCYNVVRVLTSDNPDVEFLNTADLVIISRTASSGHYSGGAATMWHSVTTPMINLNGYTLRSSRLGFTDGTTMVDTTGDVRLAVTDPTHPIFEGIPLTDGTMDNLYAEGAVPLPTDGTISRGISINNNNIDDEGTVLATIAEVSADTGPVGGMVIAEFPAGATMENSSGSPTDVLAGPRLVFLTGSREPDGVTGGQAAALYDLYPDGEKMLLNAVEYMISLKAVDVTAPGDAIKGVPDDGDWPGAETPDLAIDDNVETKYLHFKGDFDPDPGTGGAGFQVTPAAGPTIVTGLTLTTANDVPGRDPIAFELSGSNGSIDGPYELIASGDVVDFAGADEWPRFTMNATPISFKNDTAYAHYQLIFTAIRGPVGGSVNSMQIAEVELLGIPAGPIGHWKLDEGEGAVAVDSSGGGNDGTIHNADTGGLGDGGSVWVDDPERGMVISFNGDDSGAYVSTALIIPFMSLESDFTWAFWAKQHADQETNNDLILGNRYGGTGAPLQFIKFTPTRFEFFNDDYDYLEAVNYEPVPGDVWVHHVTVKDGTSLTYYRNGVEAGTSTITKTIDPNPFSMGGDATNVAEMWRGYLSDVRLYDRALSAGEVSQLAGKLGTDPGTEGLVAYYPLENDVLDASGNGNDGTIVGAPTYVEGPAGYGTAMEFHGLGAPGGGGDHIYCGNDASLDITGPISIALWIKPGADDPEGQGTTTAPMAKAMSGMDPSWSWQVRYGWGGAPQPYMAFTFNTSPRAWAFVGRNLERDEWCHIACSHDGTTLKCYLNGEQTDSTPMGQITSSSTPVLIGSDGWGCDWIGAIDEVVIYNRALSDSEIMYLAGN